jgi:hypothetical protein
MYISGLTPDASRRAAAAPQTTTAAGSFDRAAAAVIDQRRIVAALPFYGAFVPAAPVTVTFVMSGGAVPLSGVPGPPVLPAPVPLPPAPPV